MGLPTIVKAQAQAQAQVMVLVLVLVLDGRTLRDLVYKGKGRSVSAAQQGMPALVLALALAGMEEEVSGMPAATTAVMAIAIAATMVTPKRVTAKRQHYSKSGMRKRGIARGLRRWIGRRVRIRRRCEFQASVLGQGIWYLLVWDGKRSTDEGSVRSRALCWTWGRGSVYHWEAWDEKERIGLRSDALAQVCHGC